MGRRLPDPFQGDAMNVATLIAALADEPLAIQPGKLDMLVGIGAWPITSAAFANDAGRLVERFSASRSPAGSRGRSIATVKIRGAISQRDSMLTAVFGGTSTVAVQIAVRQAASDPSVATIVLDIDSPGGGVYGVAELADVIARAARSKRVVAVVNSLAASAAYWIASQASEIVVTPGGEVGSIGVYTVHRDVSAAADKAGVKNTIIKAGRHKAEGSPYSPLAADARAALQKRVDEYYTMFVSAVAKGRRVPLAEVRRGFGEGRVVGAVEAVRLGMADRVGTLDETIGTLTGDRSAAAAARARLLSQWEGEL